MPGGVCKIQRRYLISFSSYRKKCWVGAISAPHLGTGQTWTIDIASPRSGAARGGGTGGTCLPIAHRGRYRAGILTFFLQNFTKAQRFIIFAKWSGRNLRTELKLWGPWVVRGPSTETFTLFLQHFTKKHFFNMLKIKWPKSVEKFEIEMGALRS